MFQTVTRSSPDPIALPTDSAMGPETIRMTRATAQSATVMTVTISCIGRIRQNGRPSSTS